MRCNKSPCIGDIKILSYSKYLKKEFPSLIFPSPFWEYLPSVEELLKKRKQVWLHFTLILLLILSNWLFNRRICEFTSKCIIFKKWRKRSVGLIGLQYIEKLSEVIDDKSIFMSHGCLLMFTKDIIIVYTNNRMSDSKNTCEERYLKEDPPESCLFLPNG